MPSSYFGYHDKRARHESAQGQKALKRLIGKGGGGAAT
jgi:hypothetical protein